MQYINGIVHDVRDHLEDRITHTSPSRTRRRSFVNDFTLLVVDLVVLQQVLRIP